MAPSPSKQVNLFEEANTRALLDQLLTDSRLYRTGKDYQELLDFAVKLRNVAPFNAMLLQIQKPGLTFAASALDWAERFGRYLKEGARPLLILWPFGPVATVYDVQDTEGAPLPEDVSRFVARGPIDEQSIQRFRKRLAKKQSTALTSTPVTALQGRCALSGGRIRRRRRTARSTACS